MTVHSVTLHLPETLYKRFQQRAEWTHRSLEAELLDAVASAAPVEDDLLPEFRVFTDRYRDHGNEDTD